MILPKEDHCSQIKAVPPLKGCLFCLQTLSSPLLSTNVGKIGLCRITAPCINGCETWSVAGRTVTAGVRDYGAEEDILA